MVTCFLSASLQSVLSTTAGWILYKPAHNLSQVDKTHSVHCGLWAHHDPPHHVQVGPLPSLQLSPGSSLLASIQSSERP